MRALLRYATATKVARGLTAMGYPVSGPTVSRWASGRNVTPRAVRLVEELFGETKEAAWPVWARRLDAKMDAVLTAVGADPLDDVIGEVAGADEPPTSDGAHPGAEHLPAPADEPQ